MNDDTMRNENENEELDELNQEEESEELDETETDEEGGETEESEESDDFDDDNFFLDSDPDAEGETQEEQETEDDALQNEDEAENAEEDSTETESGTEAEANNQKEILSQSDEAAFYDQVTEAAKQRVQQITGEEYDEFNPKHNVILSAESTKIIGRYNKEKSAVNEMESISRQNGGEKFKQFVQQQMRKMTIEEYETLKAAELSGDFTLTLNKVKELAKEFSGNNVKQAAKEKARQFNQGAATSKKVNPPKTISSGTGSAAARNNRSNVLTPEELGIL